MSDDRPNPLGEAASKAGAIWATVSGLVGALVTFGVLSSTQASAITDAGDALSPAMLSLGTVVGGLVPLIAGLVSAFRTAATARDHVTPVASPKDNEGNYLVPARREAGPQHYKLEG